MKRILTTYFLLFLLLPLSSAQGAGRIRERIYLSTDRDVYVAGDGVWLSAWCLDAATGRLSPFSKTAYVELHSPTGMVQTAKLSLNEGRGAGRLSLPTTLPTGNYRIFAYTQLGAAETGFDPLSGARTLSVINTLSTERTAGGVEIVAQAPPAPAVPKLGSVEILATEAPRSGSGRILLTNNGTEPVSLSLSVSHDDGIPAPEGRRIGDFVGALQALPAPAGFDGSVIPEYEGEIIRARVSGIGAERLQNVGNKYAFISSPGRGENLYTESISTDGQAAFYTSNIYGDQEMFLEIEGLEKDEICHLELISPFRNLSPGEIPPLRLCPDWQQALELRGVGMQVEKGFDADTLYAALPARQHQVFDDRDRISYILDDYTRFPLMEELFVEFIPELRVRRVNGRRQLQVRTSDQRRGFRFSADNALVLLDGIPILDQEKILAYDPMLVQRIDIFIDDYFLGIRGFSGVVNFVTYKGTRPSMAFEDNVRIIDFQGCSLPQAYTCEGVGSDYPDYRQTLYWHPMLTLAPGEQLSLPCKTPVYSGRFKVVAEGLTDTGRPVSASATLDVR